MFDHSIADRRGRRSLRYIKNYARTKIFSMSLYVFQRDVEGAVPYKYIKNYARTKIFSTMFLYS